MQLTLAHGIVAVPVADMSAQRNITKISTIEKQDGHLQGEIRETDICFSCIGGKLLHLCTKQDASWLADQWVSGCGQWGCTSQGQCKLNDRVVNTGNKVEDR